MLQHNGQTLAYIGDAVYELFIRKTLIEQGTTQVGKLHLKAVAFTSAEGQKKALEIIDGMLTKEEKNIVKRGRNAQLTRRARSTDLMTYQLATGFEALLGFLYLVEAHTRIDTLCRYIITNFSE
ncbi:MAG: Mini-ribonuclease 3 [Bacillota bacterium]